MDAKLYRAVMCEKISTVVSATVMVCAVIMITHFICAIYVLAK